MRPMIKLTVCKNSLSVLHCFTSDEARQMFGFVVVGFSVLFFFFCTGLTQLHQAQENFTSFYHHFSKTDDSVKINLEEQE